MKKFLVIIAILTLTLALTSCKKDQPPDSDAPAETQQESQTIDIPEDSSDVYDLNLENAILELDLVE